MTTSRVCVVCRKPFELGPPGKRKDNPKPREVCGRTLCWAVRYFTDEDWAGRKRMAVALAATLEGATPEELEAAYVDPTTGATRYLFPRFSDLDQEALRRG